MDVNTKIKTRVRHSSLDYNALLDDTIKTENHNMSDVISIFSVFFNTHIFMRARTLLHGTTNLKNEPNHYNI